MSYQSTGADRPAMQLGADVFLFNAQGNVKTKVQAEALAREFHDVYERMAPNFGYETRQDTRQFDPETPNGRLMIAVCGDIIDRLSVDISTEWVQEVTT